MSRTIFVFAFLLLAMRCNPTPQPPPTPTPPPVPTATADAAPKPVPPTPPAPKPAGDVYDQACATELLFGCPEGVPADCAAVIRHVAAGKITTVPAACIAAAKSAVEIRACGFAKCAR
jgi:hypothetical protein